MARTIGWMQASVAAADDAQIAQIVALVDAMPHRGDADALVAAIRPRLARLRPPRPVNFTRLLFTPADPLIMPPTAWRRGGLGLPRTALVPIAQAMRDILPAEAAQVDTEGLPGPLPPKRLSELAAGIWPRAAAALETMAPPPGWLEATGLPEADFKPLTAILTAVLSVGLDIQALIMLRKTPPEAAIRVILGRTAPRGPPALSVVIVVLLARLAGAGQIVTLGTEAAGSNPSKAVESAVEHTLDSLQTAIESDIAIGSSMQQATADAARVADLLREIEETAPARLERKRRIDRLRRAADLLCRTRFEAALQEELLVKLNALPAEADDSAIEALETAARGLRRLESSGRLLGDGQRYDALLRDCLEPLQHDTRTLRVEDRVRLVEILLSAQDALGLIHPANSK